MLNNIMSLMQHVHGKHSDLVPLGRHQVWFSQSKERKTALLPLYIYGRTIRQDTLKFLESKGITLTTCTKANTRIITPAKTGSINMTYYVPTQLTHVWLGLRRIVKRPQFGDQIGRIMCSIHRQLFRYNEKGIGKFRNS
jgi:hypothetical protein